jgi:hypothetical protein
MVLTLILLMVWLWNYRRVIARWYWVPFPRTKTPLSPRQGIPQPQRHNHVRPKTNEAWSWWMEKTQQMSYPNLSRMALDILSIPAMSAWPERLFSSVKLCITELRNKLGMDILEAIECLKSWYKIQGFREGSNFREIFGVWSRKNHVYWLERGCKTPYELRTVWYGLSVA